METRERTAAAAPEQPSEGHALLKRRGLIAGAAALAVGLLARAEPVAAWDSIHGFQVAAPAAVGYATDGNADGIQGYADGATNAGVFGRNNALNGIGVQGTAPSGIGVSGGSTSGPGVSGSSSGNHGVVGTASAANTYGVYGSSSGGHGVVGTASAANTYGVYGQSTSSHSVVGIATASGMYGILGHAGGTGAGAGLFNGPVTINGTATAVPTVANTFGVVGYGQYNGYGGVYGLGNALGSIGIYGGAISGAYAGYFAGPVLIQSSLAVTGTKSALVPHPDGSHRLLYCVEAPESWFEDCGETKLTGGKAEIKLDPDFVAVAHTDAYHVFLTPYEGAGALRAVRRTAAGFAVEEIGGASGGTFSWRVVAKRKDVAAGRFAKLDLPKAGSAPKPPESPEAPTVIPLPKPPAAPATTPPAPAATPTAAPAATPLPKPPARNP